MNRKQRRAQKQTSPRQKPNTVTPDYGALGAVAYRQGDVQRALELYARAVSAEPKEHDHKVRLAYLLRNVTFGSFNPKLKALITICLKEDGIDHQDLSKPWYSLFLHDPAFQGDAPDFNDPFLQLGLRKLVVCNAAFEKTLLRLRERSTNAAFNNAFEAYCERVEYVFSDRPENLKPPHIDETIESIGLSDDDVSELVRSHYEVNPYPRWSSIHVQSPTKGNSAKSHDHLIAGCGTGFGTCATALKYPNINITAIDLSRASLSYAKAKAKALKLKNIKFYHADILKVAALDQSFDVIESSGVLHHMDDPVRGWRCLLEKLKPEGKMHIGLYSELGRQDIVAARRIVEEQGFEPTHAGIKAARDFICALPDDHAAKPVIYRRDFFSLSDCRDLIFHQQEHRFTIPQIKDALDDLGLVFMGFDHQTQHFDTLEEWDAYERENPDTFRAMYQFWCARG